MGDRIQVRALDGNGEFAAYCARPVTAASAAIIVVQEIFGVNAGIRRKADDWAALGYLAIAPDMFWRFAPSYDKDPDDPDQAADAFRVRENLDIDHAVADIEATIRLARGMIGGGRVGVIGFCMGGRVAYFSACRTDADAGIGYYGARIDQALDEAAAISRPLLLHFADQDRFIPPAALLDIHTALDANPHVTIEEYPGVDHGFADTFGKRRDDDAARRADARSIDFFARHLS